MKVNPNPKCASCKNCHGVLIDGFSGTVGYHDICITPAEPFEIEGYTAIGVSYNKCFIDGFENMNGECEFYTSNEVLGGENKK